MRAVVCGAGIAGLALAHRLAVHDWEVVVLERAPGPRPQGYMIDFFGPGYEAAEDMGLLPRLRELAHPVKEAMWVDQRGRSRARLPFSQFSRALGGRLLSIMRPELERALREHLPAAVTLRFNAELTSVDNRADVARATLADGTVLDADLLIGADGIHSQVRELTFGPERDFLRYLGLHTAAFSFESPGIHARVAGRFCLTDTIDRQLALYGLDGDRVAVFTVHRTPDPALPTDARSALRSRYDTLGWVVPDALAHCPPASEVYYDQVAQITLPRWSSGRVVLVGDACHAVSLIAGQGASLGIAGAYVMAEHLTNASSIEAGLREYERSWRPIVENKQDAARSGARWFLPSSRTQLWTRRAMLALTRIPGLDRYLTNAVGGNPATIIEHLRSSPDHSKAEPSR